jgi:hypothetical protein
MQIIELSHPYAKDYIIQEPIVLALGFFDGIHLGHKEVITTAKKVAEERGYKVAVMSFNQHPSVIFQNVDPESIQYVSPLERKKELLKELGVDIFYLVDFTKEFGALSPQEFVDQYIVGLNAKVVVAGFDYTYGKRDIANMELLPKYASNRFEIISIAEQKSENGKISSTAVRDLLLKGEIEKANELLGYEYIMNGVVVHGFGRGSKMLGFPTANIEVSNDTFLLKNGVYIVEMFVEGKWIPGMASIGINPTFDDVHKVTIEVNLLDFDKDIYHLPVRVKWLKYLRPELKFDGIDALIAQLKKDEQDTRNYFKTKRG